MQAACQNGCFTISVWRSRRYDQYANGQSKMDVNYADKSGAAVQRPVPPGRSLKVGHFDRPGPRNDQNSESDSLCLKTSDVKIINWLTARHSGLA
jgi:hypothetical protein